MLVALLSAATTVCAHLPSRAVEAIANQPVKLIQLKDLQKPIANPVEDFEYGVQARKQDMPEVRHPSVPVRGAVLPIVARNRAVVLRRLGDEKSAALWEQRAAEAEAALEKAKVKGVIPQANFDKFMRVLQSKIANQWRPHKRIVTSQIVVSFVVALDGQLERLKLVTSSGNQKLDEAALEAVRKAAPFPPLPKYADEEVNVQFHF